MAAAVPGPTWAQQSPTAASPSARYGAAMSQLPYSDTRLIMFGGRNASGILGDVWLWDGATWVRQSPAVSPPPLYGATMDYDQNTGLVLFGGTGADGPSNATWIWQSSRQGGYTWHQAAPAASPPAAPGAVMAYDPHAGQQGETVLYDGMSGETWVWDGVNWTRQAGRPARPYRGVDDLRRVHRPGRPIRWRERLGRPR